MLAARAPNRAKGKCQFSSQWRAHSEGLRVRDFQNSNNVTIPDRWCYWFNVTSKRRNWRFVLKAPNCVSVRATVACQTYALLCILGRILEFLSSSAKVKPRYWKLTKQRVEAKVRTAKNSPREQIFSYKLRNAIGLSMATTQRLAIYSAEYCWYFTCAGESPYRYRSLYLE